MDVFVGVLARVVVAVGGMGVLVGVLVVVLVGVLVDVGGGVPPRGEFISVWISVCERVRF